MLIKFNFLFTSPQVSPSVLIVTFSDKKKKVSNPFSSLLFFLSSSIPKKYKMRITENFSMQKDLESLYSQFFFSLCFVINKSD
jgi:hypothetical protein